MEEKESLAEYKSASADGGVEPLEDAVAHSRRRLFRQGAALATVTLVSKPVLACYCKSPSAWGSEQANPNISHQHTNLCAPYIRNAWSVSDWRDNSRRSAWDAGPWDKLARKCGLSMKLPGYFSGGGRDKWSGGSTQKTFDYKRVTVGDLVATCGIVRPQGVADSKNVKELLLQSDAFESLTLVTQLNYLLVPPSESNSSRYLPQEHLRSMSDLSFSSSGKAWRDVDVKSYLLNTEIAAQ